MPFHKQDISLHSPQEGISFKPGYRLAGIFPDLQMGPFPPSQHGPT